MRGGGHNRLFHIQQYFDELGPEEQQDPEKMLPLPRQLRK
jgi:hypothetical protein